MGTPVLNTPRHSWYQKRNHVRIPKQAESKKYLDADWVGDGGITPPEPTQYNLFGDTAPTVFSVNEPAGYTLGLVVQFAVPALVTALRWYKGPDDPVTARQGHFRDGDGVILSEANASGLSGTGWKLLPLSTPVEVTPGPLYVICANAPAPAYYGATAGLGAVPIAGPVVIMPSSAQLAPLTGNGRFYQDINHNPTESYGDTVYGVDIVAEAL